MKLVIAEKPSVARSIADVIGATQKRNGYIEGSGYIVSWCVGHLAGFEEPNSKWDINELPIIPSDNLVVKESTKEQFEIVKKLMERSDVTSLVCATDAGREGEAIFRYTYHAAKCKKPFERLWISSMTDSSIREGFDMLQDGHNYDNLYLAAVARDKADSLVGISGTRLFSCLYQQFNPPLSVGRVQTPTLSMIVQRENAIKNFIKEKSYKVHLLTVADGKQLELVSENIVSHEQTCDIANGCKNANVIITSVDEEMKKIASPHLYDLTTLQRDCNRMFGYTAQQTLNTVQELYESGLCTYPRTDSKYLTEDMEEIAWNVITNILNSAPFIPNVMFNPQLKNVLNSKKVSDHHAIIPDGIKDLDWNSLSSEKYNVLGLITTRLLAATALPYQYKSTQIMADCNGTTFKALGKVETESGFKVFERAFQNVHKTADESITEEDDKDTVTEDNVLPDVAQGDTHVVSDTKISEHWTQPPKHFNEDSILAAMENAGADEITEDAERKGLGTTATRAGIIENLIARGYVERSKKNLIPTERAYKLMDVVPDELKNPKMTAEMENTLSLVAKGQANSDKFLEDMIIYMTKIVNENKDKKIENNQFGSQSVNEMGSCPNCNSIVKKGKYGAYCTGKCGMNIAKVYGKQLTDKQVTDLLNGKKITYTNGNYVNTVLSDIQPFSYEDKDGVTVKGFQWKTESKKK